MKNAFLKLFALAAIVGSSMNVSAQTSASETTDAGAVLIVAMTLTETSPMHFGSIVLTGTTGGTVVLPSNSITRSFTGDVAASSATPAPTNAAYNVTGTRDETYALTLPANFTVSHVSVNSGVDPYTMTVNNMTARFNGAGADAVTSQLSSSGTDSFTLGGTLNVQANQVGGQYTGNFNISIDYN